MEIFTIIVTYNATRNNWIRKCLESLKSSSVQTTVLIIDNNSSDSTCEIIKEEFPFARLIESKENVGFAKANNIGIKEAYHNNAEFVFLLNQDARIEVDTLKNLIETSKKFPKFGIISPIHLNGQGNLLDFLFLHYISSGNDESRQLYTDLLKKNTLSDVYSISFINAAAWLMTKKCIETVGLFDDKLFSHYGEDNNYVQRLQYKNLNLGVVPNTFIFHDREERRDMKATNTFITDKDKFKFICRYSNINVNYDFKSIPELVKLKSTIKYYKNRFNYSKARQYQKLLDEKEEIIKTIQQQFNVYKQNPKV